MGIEVFDSARGELYAGLEWFELASGAHMTRMPMWDPENLLFARWGAAEGAAKLKAMGMRLPTWQEYAELHAHALFIAPVTLPTQAMAQADPAHNYPGSPLMVTEDWCRIHDTEVFNRLVAANWTGQPIANAGKHWCYDGGIYGWWNKDGSMIQGLSYFHEPGQVPHVPPQGDHHDYATTCHAVVASGVQPPAPPSGGGGKSLYPKGSGAGSAKAKRIAVGLTVTGIASGLLWWLG